MMDDANGFSDEFQLAALCDERLARHAVSAGPAWLWSADGLHIHWANAAGADVLGARNSTELARVPRSPADRGGRQIARLAGQLVRGGPLRLERLAGFGAALGGLTTCACMRIAFNAIRHGSFETNPREGILVVSVDAPSRIMPLEQRLACVIDGIDAPLAVFAANGRLVATTSSAGAAAAEAETLADFGGKLAQISLGEGRETAFIAVVPPHLELPIKKQADGPATAMPEIDPDSVIAQHLSEQNFIDSAKAAESFLERANDRFDEIAERDSVDQNLADQTLAEQTLADQTLAMSTGAPPENPLAEPAPAPIMENLPQAPAARSDDRDLHMPLRFVWQTDANHHFTLQDSEFTHLAGSQVMAQMGRTWSDIAEALDLDPRGAIAQAMASHETWTGLVALWPVDDSGTRLPTELSGIPVYDAERTFAGFRGFGICRDQDALAQLAALRAQPRSPATSMTPPPAVETETIPDAAPTVDVVTDAEPALIESAISESTMSEPPAVVSEPPAIVSAANVLPFRFNTEQKPPVLTPVENSAFNEIARQLSARLEGKAANDSPPPLRDETSTVDDGVSPHSEPTESIVPQPETVQEPVIQPVIPSLAAPANNYVVRGGGAQERTLLERLPFGILVYRLDRLLFANPTFLERTGFASLHDLTEAGGLDALYVEPGVATSSSTSEGGTPLRVSATEADPTPADARLISMNWDDEAALALVLLPPSGAAAVAGVAPAAAMPITPAEVARPAAASVETAPQQITPDKDPTPDTNTESELAQARREINRIATAKADLLARISHDIRAPLSAVTGFAEMMIEQRFGPLGNERYVEYMKGIRASGERVASIVNDMLDVSQIESGQVALAFTANNLNHVVEQCVSAMQPQANRERVIIRSSLAKALPPVIADARALRQIAMTLMASAIRMSRTGAQIIVSTALGDTGEVALRLRDAGYVMSESEIGAVMDPLGSRPPEDGNGASLDLSVARALVSANRAVLNIRSTTQTGTLIEVIFPVNDKRMSYAN